MSFPVNNFGLCANRPPNLSQSVQSAVGRPRLPLALAILSLMVDFGTPQVPTASRRVV